MTTLKETANPLESVAWLITYASVFDSKIKTDPMKERVWLDKLGDFDPHLIRRGIETYYSNPDKARWEINPGVLLSWCLSASPKPPRCPDHPSYLAGTKCGGCRAERLELGLEKPIGQTTVPQITQGARTPMPETLRKAIGNVGRAV